MKWREWFRIGHVAINIRPPGDSESVQSSINARQVSGARIVEKPRA